MDLLYVGLLGIVILLFLLFVLGMPVGFTMAIVGFLGFGYVVSLKAALSMLGPDLWSIFSSDGFTVIPLFIFMGFLSFNAGIAERLYLTAYKWFGHWRGGLAIATIGACEMFAAICGSNTATAATMGAVALPQMKKYKYDMGLSAASVATGGALGSVMPPSVVLIIIALQTEQSIVDLFFAGIFPALLMGLLLIVTVWIMCRFNPSLGPAGPKTSFREKVKSLYTVAEALAIFILVLGGLYAGFFTPTEAGAMGVFFTLCVSLVGKRLTLKKVIDAIDSTLKISCMVFMLVTGAIIFGRFLAVTRLPFEVASFISGLSMSNYVILSFILIIYLIGGCIMDSLGFLVLTIPIFFPLATALGFDPLWYSIILAIVTTMGAITPPVGVNIYVVKALDPDIPLEDIFKSISFFMLACIITIILLFIFPDLILWLPSIL
jgi:tripartite ATP-independent transporter DctM subunit